jgi:hypothetical protein
MGVDAPSRPPLLELQGARYSFATLLVIALVAFLFGSLLRSLLSPTDYIYTPTQVEDGQQGWRQISRLLEINFPLVHMGLIIGVIR